MLLSSAISTLLLPTPPSSFRTHRTGPNAPFIPQNIFNAENSGKRICTLHTTVRLSSSSSDNQTVTVTASQTAESDDDVAVQSASDVVKGFYEGINGNDLGSVEDLIAENCVYEDLIFPSPFIGREAILKFFKKFVDSISRDLQFVIDDKSAEDSSAVGVTWHLEWKGRPFPFSKGCSFYRLEVVNGKRQIVYGRDSVEPAFKPGETALAAIRGVTWLLQQFPQLADQL